MKIDQILKRVREQMKRERVSFSKDASPEDIFPSLQSYIYGVITHYTDEYDDDSFSELERRIALFSYEGAFKITGRKHSSDPSLSASQKISELENWKEEKKKQAPRLSGKNNRVFKLNLSKKKGKKMDTKYFNSDRGSLTDADKQEIFEALAKGLHPHNRSLMYRRIFMNINLIPHHGILNRIMNDGNGWGYCAGQSYVDEMRTVRKIILDCK